MKTLFLVLAAGVAWMLGAAPVKVACIGDSITYGTGLADRAREGYPAQLQRLLGPDYEVRNFGNPGRGIYLHSWRGKERRGYRHMPEHRAALEWQPDIVICNLGINDNGEFLKTERAHPGRFRDDYLKLLGDYQALPTKPRLYIWGKLAPLAPGQNFYRSPEPFLMQTALAEVAERSGATAIDLQAPLRPLLLTAFPDKIHPTAEGARVIAETVFAALNPPPPAAPQERRPRTHVGWAEPLPAPAPVALPADIAGRAETWLCAGQSNMFWPLGRCVGADAEAAATARHDIRLWDFVSGQWRRLTPANAKEWSAVAVSFALRRAEASGKPIAVLLVDVGGAPTEAFLPEPVMAAVDAEGKARFPTLCRIVTNRKPLGDNEDLPRSWCKTVYAARQNAEAGGWGVSVLYDKGIGRLRHLPLTGILWYQGESNASVAIGGEPDAPLPEGYMEETLRAVVLALRPNPQTPFLMMGLPVMNRPWGPYRALQKKVCAETGAIYLDTFAAGLGDPKNIHPTNKIPFAEMAAKAAEKALSAARD